MDDFLAASDAVEEEVFVGVRKTEIGFCEGVSRVT